MKFRFRLDLYRTADNVLMATSLVRKALNVPEEDKRPGATGSQRWT
jgi:hypothetical protein